MTKISLQAKARQLAHQASESTSGRAADTIFGGHEKRLRQTVVALRAGTEMVGPESLNETTLLVIAGRLWVVGEDTKWSGREWSYVIVPDTPHRIVAETDTVLMLTVAMLGS